MKRGFVYILCAALMISMLVMPASAAGGVDMDREGSISLTMRYRGKVVPGGSLTLYRVADVTEDDGNYGYCFVEEFAGCGLSLENPSSAKLAKELKDYAKQESISGTTKTIDRNGKVTFDKLEVGLYLLEQKEAASGYSAVSPFLVGVPGKTDGVYVYDVDAAPKLSIRPAETTAPTTAPTKPTSSDLPQTGQTNWPVPALAALGLLFILTGWYLNRSEKKKEQEA